MTHNTLARHPLALTLALLITAQRHQYNEWEEKIHTVIERLVDLAGWSDERRADLYARIADKVTAADRCIDMEHKINDCLWANEGLYR